MFENKSNTFIFIIFKYFNILYLKVHGTFLQSQYSTENRYFKFKLQQSVRVTESFYPDLSIAELFSSLGGVLGRKDHGIFMIILDHFILQDVNQYQHINNQLSILNYTRTGSIIKKNWKLSVWHRPKKLVPKIGTPKVL